MQKSVSAQERSQTRGEEMANAASHGIGLVAAIVATPFLILHAINLDDTGFIVGASVFAISMLLLYLSSTVYHLLPADKTKSLFQVIEHSAIFILIAGTYTPFTLGALSGSWGLTLLVLIWCLAAAGVLLKIFIRTVHPVISTGLYLLMGWLIVIAIQPLSEHVPAPGIAWLFAGGAAYTLGVIFFAMGSYLKYGHFIWHLFVMTGTTCHYFAVLWYAA